MNPVRRSSRKRQAIYDALCETKSHPSAEQLYSALKNEIPDLSLGTVYRNLSLLVSDGLAVSVGNVDGQERYDADTSSHVHLICTRCGRIDDSSLVFPCPELSELEAETGWSLFTHSLTLRGLCSECSCIERSEVSADQ